MENLNLVELLRDCPTGMELDCTAFDNITFDYVNTQQNRVYCKVGKSESVWFTAKGCINLAPSAKCVIFPKGKTTWDGFVPPVEFKDGDILTTDLGSIFILKESNESVFYYSCYIALNDVSRIVKNYTQFCIKKGCRLATEEEKAKLFDAIKANGYRWNAETKTLEKLVEPKFKVGDRIQRHKERYRKDNIYTITRIDDIRYIVEGHPLYGTYAVPLSTQDEYGLVPNKFDIATLKPFDKVLVRIFHEAAWKADFFSHYTKDADYPFSTVGKDEWYYCIPFEHNEHLLGTTNDCDPFFKTWEK